MTGLGCREAAATAHTRSPSLAYRWQFRLGHCLPGPPQEQKRRGLEGVPPGNLSPVCELHENRLPHQTGVATSKYLWNACVEPGH